MTLNRTVAQLAELSADDLADDDVLPVQDVSAGREGTRRLRAGAFARAVHGIPVVADETERDELFPTPTLDQRVQIRSTGEIQRYGETDTWVAVSAGSSPFLAHLDARISGGEHINFPDDTNIGVFVVLNGDVEPPRIELWANAPYQAPYRLAAREEPTTTDPETPGDNVATNVVLRETSLPTDLRPIESAFTLQMLPVIRAEGTAIAPYDPLADELVLDADPADATSVDDIRAGITGNPLHLNAGVDGDWAIAVGEGIEGGNALRCRYSADHSTNSIDQEFEETQVLAWSFWFKTSPGADPTHGDPENTYGFKFWRIFRALGYYTQISVNNLGYSDPGGGTGGRPALSQARENLFWSVNDPDCPEGLPFSDPRGSDYSPASKDVFTWGDMSDGAWHFVQMEIMTGPLGYEMMWVDDVLIMDGRTEAFGVIKDRGYPGYVRLHGPANLVVHVPAGQPGFSLYYDKLRAWRRNVL